MYDRETEKAATPGTPATIAGKSGKQQRATGTKTSRKSNSRSNFKRGGTGGNYRNNCSVPRTTNPADWYYPNEQLGKDSANISFNTMTGRPFKIWNDSSPFAEHAAAPGVMTLRLALGIGNSTDPNSIINVAGRSIYSWVRHQNSGHANYEAPDLLIYILAMQEIYAMYAHACRIYRTAMTYTYTNRYTPDVLLYQMGVDARNIRDNLAQFRAGLNVIAAKVSSLAVPNNFKTFERHSLLFSNVFLDSETERGQYYLFVPGFYRVFDPTGDTGGFLKTHALPTNRTYDQILGFLNEMVESVLQDEDMNIMSGDILKAYGRENLYTVKGITEQETCLPTYNADILSQIENCNSACLIYDHIKGNNRETEKGAYKLDTSSLDITQTSGSIRFKPFMKDPSPVPQPGYKVIFMLPENMVLNTHSENADWKTVLESSRFMLTYFAEDTTEPIIYVDGGTEIVSEIQVSFNVMDKTGAVSDAHLFLPQFAYIQDASANGQIFPAAMPIVTSWDWHPILYYAYVSGIINLGIGYGSQTPPICDYAKYAVISPETIKNMHQCALLGLFRTNLLQ